MIALRTIRCAAVLAVALLIDAVPARAQTWGVKGGLNLANLSVEDFETSAEPSAVAGGFYRLPPLVGIRIQVEGLIAQRRVSFEDTVRDELNYLEVPILARYPVFSLGGRAVHALGGGVLGFRLSANEIISGESVDVKEAYEPFDFGAALGGEVAITRRWLADVRYIFGLTNVQTAPGFEAKFRTWQVTVGYAF